MIRTTSHAARHWHRCDSCRGRIHPGDAYLVHVASPNHGELGNIGWWRSSECSECARRYGRGDRLLPAAPSRHDQREHTP